MLIWMPEGISERNCIKQTALAIFREDIRTKIQAKDQTILISSNVSSLSKPIEHDINQY